MTYSISPKETFLYKSFEEIYQRFYYPMVSFFMKRGFSPDESTDLAQQTFLGAYRSFSRFRREGAVESWLFTIAANVWADTLRKKNAQKRGSPTSLEREPKDSDKPALPLELEDPGPSPLDSLLESECRELLYQAIEELPAKMRQCMVFRLFQNLKYREIALLLGMSIEDVKSQLYQGRQHLKKTLSTHEEPKTLLRSETDHE